MADSKHATLSYYFQNTETRIITPIQLFSYPFNSTLSLSSTAMWDTGAVMSAITPEIRNKFQSKTVNRRKITSIHTTEEVDIVIITFELPNRVLKQTIEVAVCNLACNAGMIIGMDIISYGDFALSNGNNQTLFSFAVPPFQNKIDFSKRQNEP